MAKITKEQAEYIHVEGTNYKCDECRDFNPIGLCRLFSASDTIKWFGSCNKWASGTPSAHNIPQNITTPKEAGYLENPSKKGYSCKRCGEFKQEKWLCEKVSERGQPDNGIISRDGCCDCWQFHPVFSIL